jgi:hypothetical protein
MLHYRRPPLTAYQQEANLSPIERTVDIGILRLGKGMEVLELVIKAHTRKWMYFSLNL